ncbi:DUF2155 domain-containing protein [Enterovirga sp.]|uniref:DUF2155 domain-containing protein n=1 Tax=Enterovirga sp. TaxID=2026350 RepID=UPI002BC73AE6|nr:DUF2155 domain-containing protein [Enterovirga sp.]HMO28961.1 DUF2155 domain-containing protein [Enterovirga sp.]
MQTRAIKAVTGIAAGFLVAGGVLLALAPARADKIKNPTAVFNGLDKITGRIIAFDVAVDETVQFGALQITPRVCYSRPPTEAPQTDGFVEVDEVTLDNKYRRIFSGWMFAASPGLHGVEHPIYDVWLTDCKGGTAVIADAKEKDDAPPTAEAKPEKRQQRQAKRTNSAGQIDVEGPRGREVQPRQASRRYYPTNEGATASPPSPPGYGGFNPAR